MADRTVVAKLVLDVTGYTPAAVAASKSTSALATAQKETAAAARDAGLAQREAATAAKDAAATASASAQAMTVAQKEATAAAKEAAASEVAAARATTDAERLQAEAVATTAAERSAAAKQVLTEATAQADADARAAAAAKTGASEAAKYAVAQRDVAAAAKEAAGAEAAAAKETDAAAAKRAEAYKASGTAMTTMALGTGAAIGLLVKSAGDFQSSTQHLVTDAGENQKDLDMVRAGILKTATATGTGATQLVDAMYHIESAGFHGKAGLDMLTTSAQGAKVGAADLGTVAKTLTGTMNSYSTAGLTSVQMMNMLIATTAAGDMKMNDLAGSLGNVAPKAAAAGIKFSEVGGAIATMTSQNMSADQATQDLANTIGNLQKPSNIAINQMQQLGLNSNDVTENLGKRGLTGTLELLTNAVAAHTQNGQVFIDTLKNSQNAAADANTILLQLPQSIQGISKQLMDGSITAAQYNKGISALDAPQQHMAKQFEQLVKGSGAFNDLLKSGKPDAESFSAAMSNLLGGSTGLNTALMLTGGRMQTFKDNAASIQAAADKGGSSVDNWAKIQQTFNQKLDVAKASIGAAGIAIGTTFLPAAADMAKWVTSIVTPIAAWVDKHQGLTSAILGSAAALAALVLAIKVAAKTGELIKASIEGITTAIGFYSRSAETAAAKTEAMGAATATAAAETDAAAVSTGSWAGKLGGAVPVLGAVVLGAQALGGELNKLVDGENKNVGSVDQWTTSLLSGRDSANMFGMSAQQAQKEVESLGGKADAAISPMAAIGVEMAKNGQMMGDGAAVVKNYDGALAALVSGGHADRAATLMAEIASATDKQGKALINTQADFPQYWAAVNQGAANQALAAGATTNATAALGDNTTAQDANSAATLVGTDATGQATDAQRLSTAAMKAAVGAQNEAADAAQNLDSSVTDEVTAMKDAQTKAGSLKEALDALNGVHISAAKSAVDEQQKVADLTKAFDANGKSIDITTESGRKNMTAILDLAGAINAHAKAVTDETGSVDAGNKVLDANRQQFDAVLKSAGLSTGQIDDFNKTLLNTPKMAPVTLLVNADTTAASAALRSLESQYGGTGIIFGGGSSGKHIVAGMSTGGLVTGAGTGTSDSVPIRASAGEYMVKASVVQQPGVLAALNALNFGNGTTSVVKPSIPLYALPSPAASSGAGGRGAALHIENYFENGSSPQAVASELGWLAKSRGSSW